MLRLVITEHAVEVVLSGWAMIAACKRRFTVPRRCIAAVHHLTPELRPPWCRCPGTCIPGLLTAGTYLGRGRREFWYVRRDGAVVLELTGHRYTRVVVQVENAAAVLDTLQPAVTGG